MRLFSNKGEVGQRPYGVSTEDGERYEVYAYNESHAGRMVQDATGVPPVDVWRRW